jgi:hypothetical protein
MEQKTETVKKKNSNKIILIIVSVVIAIFLIVLLVGFFLFRAFFSFTNNIVQEIDTVNTPVTVDVDYEQESVLPTDPKVDEELEGRKLITNDFPEDIPLSGGKVTGSASDEWNIKVEISTGSTLDEVFDWYVEKLEESGWEITSRSKQMDMYGQISFEKDDRKGDVKLAFYPWVGNVSVEVREIVYSY